MTGAAGQIAYALNFRIANGDMLGKDQPVILQLLELPRSIKALEGTAMELQDCAFPLLAGIEIFDDPMKAFDQADYALLVGARPRSKGMERSDLLSANAEIFTKHGQALNEKANPQVKVLVVGNPANTNAYIAMKSAPNIPRENFTAMMRLDHNRALSMLAEKCKSKVSDVTNLVVWGNHSPTMYPDVHFASIHGKKIKNIVEENWLEQVFIPQIGKRGATIIEARGASSAASAANAAIDHMHDWVHGTGDKWTTMAVPSEDSKTCYGVPKDIIFGFPVKIKDGHYSIIRDLELNEYSKNKISRTLKELIDERDAIQHLLK